MYNSNSKVFEEVSDILSNDVASTLLKLSGTLLGIGIGMVSGVRTSRHFKISYIIGFISDILKVNDKKIEKMLTLVFKKKYDNWTISDIETIKSDLLYLKKEKRLTDFYNMIYENRTRYESIASDNKTGTKISNAISKLSFSLSYNDIIKNQTELLRIIKTL